MSVVNFLRDVKVVLEAVCKQYEKTAPTVCDWADDLYIRIDEDPASVNLSELTILDKLTEDGWEQPNYAANRVYKMLSRLGRETAGQAGF